ncbi:hypothetical protein RRG08_039980 [Elysia crispata]|uniref:Uncharacterized protein n=1 Tax=Elysia crispata TaxID=231223 RepID=A0AAE1DBB3_9GAST|nr:hypothetical protein RRG08_039980 [Elysia crispata]
MGRRLYTSNSDGSIHPQNSGGWHRQALRCRTVSNDNKEGETGCEINKGNSLNASPGMGTHKTPLNKLCLVTWGANSLSSRRTTQVTNQLATSHLSSYEAVWSGLDVVAMCLNFSPISQSVSGPGAPTILCDQQKYKRTTRWVRSALRPLGQIKSGSPLRSTTWTEPGRLGLSAAESSFWNDRESVVGRSHTLGSMMGEAVQLLLLEMKRRYMNQAVLYNLVDI